MTNAEFQKIVVYFANTFSSKDDAERLLTFSDHTNVLTQINLDTKPITFWFEIFKYLKKQGNNGVAIINSAIGELGETEELLELKGFAESEAQPEAPKIDDDYGNMFNSLEEIKEELKAKVAAGEMDTFYTLFKKKFKSNNAILLNNSRYSSLKKSLEAGTISHDNSTMQLAKITNGLLATIDRLEEKDLL